MTQDQPEKLLSSFYKDSIKKAKEYLKERYRLTEFLWTDNKLHDLVPTLSEDLKEGDFWLIEIEGSWKTFDLLVAVPNIFPDLIPKIYVKKTDLDNTFKSIPHLDQYGMICTRDQDIIAVNDRIPGNFVEELLEIAVKEIIEPGIKQENQSEFITEFLAYWDEKCLLHVATAFDIGGNITKTLKCFELSQSLFGSSCYLITESFEKAAKLIEPYGIKIKSDNGDEVLYLPLLTELPVDIVLRRKGVPVSILGNLPSNYKRSAEAFFNTNKDGYYVLCSFPIDKNVILFGWRHPKWKMIKGFRLDHVPLDIRLLNTTDNSVGKIKTTRIDKKRLLSRGGVDGTFIEEDVSVGIIGCGSVGSFLSMSLARAGIALLSLFDKEHLEVENIGRHLCGFSDVIAGMNKVDAVKKAIHDQFPGIEIVPYSINILELVLEQGYESLQGHNLILVATASLSVERRINYLSRSKVLNCPIIYLWMEVLGVAGHLLYIDPNQGGCYECCLDEKGQCLYSVSKPGQLTTKREAGCQTTFLPVNSIDTEQFVHNATKVILSLLKTPPNHSILYTWLGDLEAFQDKGYLLNDMYLADFSGTLNTKKIVERESCQLCYKR
jgi:molybdopterin/thiamine biosynthesis adenylyltransferase